MIFFYFNNLLFFLKCVSIKESPETWTGPSNALGLGPLDFLSYSEQMFTKYLNAYLSLKSFNCPKKKIK